eukprot:1876713-Amphidinium_carterae.1
MVMAIPRTLLPSSRGCLRNVWISRPASAQQSSSKILSHPPHAALAACVRGTSVHGTPAAQHCIVTATGKNTTGMQRKKRGCEYLTEGIPHIGRMFFEC